MVELIQRRSAVLPSYPELLRQHADLLEENERLQVEAVGYRLIADASGGTLSLNEFAKSMNWGRNRLSKLLGDKGIVIDGGAVPYQQYITSGNFIFFVKYNS